MKLSLNWLKDYLDVKLSTDELLHKLTMAGLEVEGVHKEGKDTVIELEVTPNRPDCLSVLGLARDIAAITFKKLALPAIKTHKIIKSELKVKIEDKSACTRYVATLLKGAQVKSTNAWRTYLDSVGIRSISNAVDITNFVLMEMGQPLHVFDYDKIEGGQVIIRRAKANESIVTLDGVERKLDPSILIIADSVKPIAIAGIMGGLNTQVTAGTQNILLESAHFNGTLIRRASRALGLRSDSSYRFERGVDINGVLQGANRATDLLVTSTGSKIAGRADVHYESKAKLKAIVLKVSDVKDRLSLNLSAPQLRKMLLALGFKVSGSKDLKVIAPSFRGDVKQTVDLIEEIARLVGFDKLPMAMPVIKAENIVIDDRLRQFKRQLRTRLLGLGLDETVTFATTNKRDLKRCQLEEVPVVAVANPLNIDQELMRPSLLPSLLQVALTNINRGQKDLRIFELGKRYTPDGEKEMLAILVTGKRYQDWRSLKKDTVEFADLKGIVEKAINLPLDFVATTWHVFDSSACAQINYKGKQVGAVGKLNKQVLLNWDIKNQDVYFAALDLSSFVEDVLKSVKYQPIAAYPAIVRDVSLSVNKDVVYQKIEAICRKEGGPLLQKVQFIEQYIGDKLPQGQKALVFSLVYQSPERTLREEEVAASHDAIVKALTTGLGATRR